MLHIKLHGNPKTNVKAKTNPNRNLQKTWKKNLEKTKKILAHTGSRTRTGVVQCEDCNHWTTKAANPGVNFLSFNIHRKAENAIKNKTNTDCNPTTNANPNPTIDEAGKRKVTE